MEIFFSISEMAKLSGLTRQTLIYYDNKNIFKPCAIKENGYRMYSSKQLEELDTILIYKEIGMTLEQIQLLMNNRDIEYVKQTMTYQKNLIANKIKELKLIEDRIDNKIMSYSNYEEANSDEIKILECNAEYLAVEKLGMDNGLAGVDIALKKLLGEANEKNYSHFYQLGDIVSMENVIKGEFLVFDYAFLPLEKPCDKSYMLVKPKGKYVVGYHKGSYKTVGETYNKMLEFIKANDLEIIGNAYEYCIYDSLITSNKNDYVTKIQIYIK